MYSAAASQDDPKSSTPLCRMTVSERYGTACVDRWCRFGAPIARGNAPHGVSFCITDEYAQALPAQFEVIAAWPDGSAKWVLVDCLVTLEKNCSKLLSLQLATAESSAVSENADLVVADDTIEGSFGMLNFKASRGASSLLEQMLVTPGQNTIAARLNLVLIDASGNRRDCCVDRVTLVRDGPLRSTLEVSGGFAGGSSASELVFTARIDIVSNAAELHLDIDIWNPRAAIHPNNCWDLGDLGSVTFQSISLELLLPSDVSRVSWTEGRQARIQQLDLSDEWTLQQVSSGGENWDSTNHIDSEGNLTVARRGYVVRHENQEIGSGYRAEPVVEATVDGTHAAVSVVDFWQNFPTSISCTKRVLGVGLFAACGDNLFEIQGGERKRHEVVMSFAGVEDGSLITRHKLMTDVAVDPKFVAASRAMPYFVPSSDDQRFAACNSYVRSIVEGDKTFKSAREVIDEYGWRNYGELYADHEAIGSDSVTPIISHYNNQYDFVAAAALHYLRSGDTRWYDLLRAAARHHRDIDIYHTDRDRIAYNGGLFWHTDHYKDAATATHRTYSRRNATNGDYGGGPSNEHNYTTGFLYFYWLTGDVTAREAVISLATWVLQVDDGALSIFAPISNDSTGRASSTAEPGYHGPGRGAGNSINALLDAWQLTGERPFMQKIEELVARCVHPQDNIDELGLDDPESRWSYLVFLQVLGKFLAIKEEYLEFDYHYYYARDCLLHYAHWVLNNEVPYKEVLHKVDKPTETWPAQDIRKCHIMHLASKYDSEPANKHFQERADFYYKRCLDDLLQFDTAYLCRPRVIIAGYGHIHEFEMHAIEKPDLPERCKAHPYCFASPTRFLPQSAGWRNSFGRRLRAAFKEFRHQWQGRWHAVSKRKPRRNA